MEGQEITTSPSPVFTQSAMFEPLGYDWNHGSFGYLLLLLVPSTRSRIWFLYLFFWGGGGAAGVLVGWLVRCTYNSTEFFPVGFMGVGENAVHI